MSFNQAPPLAGPGGAYGPVPARADQIVPGGAVDLGMAKPRTVTGIQTILWLFAVLAAGGDLIAALTMAEKLNPLSLISLVYAIYATIQAVVTPLQIAQGKRWAWIWAVVSAVLGIAVALTATMFGMTILDRTTWPVLGGIAVGLLYAALLALLLSKPARAWILMNRVKRGEITMQQAAAVHPVPRQPGPRYRAPFEAAQPPAPQPVLETPAPAAPPPGHAPQRPQGPPPRQHCAIHQHGPCRCRVPQGPVR
ncbi:hypothetical protein [Glycomyces algeriensis]|uniref:Uncharacterized protein n=1 Tax=Glycomyces algeriensis TaxID=256037 RepID=A0A9W6G8F9_9ACTN|nr:hypothetical protein [Glycomyces algeriensis]MDA1367945.1 hypothetical protein [Glycomyces algeriensis]MDR7349484.1 hypothetical protein [Glycomyces algeriensis]GLI42189.1 hypothetical protein GALLR39Z86_20390 [Glycomyces algeriensis]